MIAAELMTEDPVTVRADATIEEAMRLLRERGVRHLPVVSAEGELVGILADRDLALLTTPSPRGDGEGERTAMPVARFMSSDVVSVDPRSDVVEIVEALLENEIGAVVVVESGSRLVGIVSYVDVLRAFPRAVAEVAEQMEGRAAGRRASSRAGA